EFLQGLGGRRIVKQETFEVASRNSRGRSDLPVIAQQTELLAGIEAFERIDVAAGHVALLIVAEPVPEISDLPLGHRRAEIDADADLAEIGMTGVQPET